MPSRSREREQIALRLQVLRFRKLLEHGRGLIDLFEDGSEKRGGEYIFDLGYVDGLIDSVLERAGRLAFDACVLNPDGGVSLLQRLDHHRRYARERLVERRGEYDPGSDDVPYEGGEELEFRALTAVTDWLEGPGSDGRPSMMEFIRQGFEQAIAGIERTTYPDSGMRVGHWRFAGMQHDLTLLEDNPVPAGTEVEEMRPSDLGCRPLSLLLQEPGEAPTATETERSQSWFAAVGPQTLSLRSREDGAPLLLEASLGGHADSDFLFVCFPPAAGLEELLGPGFRIEPISCGRLAWSYDVPSQTLEGTLARLGRRLFGRPDGAPGA